MVRDVHSSVWFDFGEKNQSIQTINFILVWFGSI